ncbi:hypothetical protein [Jiangella asiatica]|uniref:Uncharacterized protein n=1 Tax=Jiangella asiatica TaxID=2530372 RepID=A0A4R5D9G0_9ACTN|nr:hypothetical protein [Jiangella asiatica]TDE08381.1 hypothetical protein E1269_17925 [Jiangella asiatica]
MNVVAVILLATAGVTGAVAWYAVEHRRSDAPTSAWLAAAAVPVVLVGAAALFGRSGAPADAAVRDLASAAAVVTAVTGGSLVATALLRVADRGRGALGDDAVTGDATMNVSDPQTLRGGTSIGALERIGVAVTLLAGWPEGLVLVLGVKGLGRYPELRRPAAAERFIIGTLASVLWAVAAVGVVYTLRT